MFKVYWLISEDKKKTYVGFSDNIEKRTKEHVSRQVKTTREFGKFKCYVLESVDDLESARRRERYWKSSAGRKKLKEYFDKIE